MHAVLAGLRLVDALQEELGLLAGLVYEQDVVAGAAEDRVVDGRRPELGELVGVGAVEDESKLGGHQPGFA